MWPQPYSPESNGMAEAFVKTFKRDYVYFGNLQNAQAVLEQLPKWIDDYHNKAPHKALRYSLQESISGVWTFLL
jgi:putative transposase